jgi:hypothetical protein
MEHVAEISLATPEDDAELRDLYCRHEFSGSLSIVYKREPSFFHALEVMGDRSQVMVLRQDKRIIATGTITFFKAFVRGKPQTIGYLHSLRVDAAYRLNIYLAQGFQKLHQLLETQGITFYIATIIEDNNTIGRMFKRPRSFMPPFLDMGRYNTYVIPLFWKRKRYLPISITSASGCDELAAGIAWIQQWGQTRDLYPVFTLSMFQDLWMKKYGLQDLLLARHNGRIVGTLAAWNQSSFRQTVVHGYNGKWRLLKPCYNALAMVMHGSRLPEAHKEFKYLFASFPTAEDDNPEILRELIAALCKKAINTGYTYVVIGLHASDPLNKALQNIFTIRYTSRVYIVTLQDYCNYDFHLPYLELARL